MKKFFEVVLLGGLCASIAIMPSKKEVKAIEPPAEIIETEKLPDILTDQELSMLYTCKQDLRKEDPTIVNLTYDDAQLLLKVGRAEGGPRVDGQLWTMRTIYNRLAQHWKDSLWDILNDDTQFAVVTNGSYRKADVNAASHIALAKLEMGVDPTEGALYWESNTNSPDSWHKKNLTFIKEVEGNLFYK